MHREEGACAGARSRQRAGIDSARAAKQKHADNGAQDALSACFAWCGAGAGLDAAVTRAAPHSTMLLAVVGLHRPANGLHTRHVASFEQREAARHHAVQDRMGAGIDCLEEARPDDILPHKMTDRAYNDSETKGG